MILNKKEFRYFPKFVDSLNSQSVRFLGEKCYFEIGDNLVARSPLRVPAVQSKK